MKDIISSGDLLVYLADNPIEIEAAQRLRYKVFYNEMGAVPSLATRRTKLDEDPFDPICDHLLVVDKSRSNGKPFVVGTYRLLRRSVALKADGFYSRNEFDLSTLMGYPGEIVELGRSCVHADYRSGGVMQLLWRGIAAYLDAYDIEMMFGCASFPGTDPEAIKAGLSYLHHYHLAPAEIRPRAQQTRFVDMGKIQPDWLDRRSALSELPPLIKGYLRVGGVVGEGAVIDRQFNTTDICVIVECTKITERYRRHYKPSGTS
ncbi:MAG: GNAT family N-acyltransferase [Rhodospirillales bacterium]